MKWLVTGGCGFLGLNLIARLLEKGGHSIRVLDSLVVGSREDLAAVTPYREVAAWEPIADFDDCGIQLVVGDIRDAELVLRAAVGADVIVHLAANTGVISSVADPRLDCEVNVLGTLNCLEAARLQRVQRFVYASTGAVVGGAEPPFREEMPTRPLSPYGASKLAGEAYCSAYRASYGVQTVALRFSNVYGPWSCHKNSVVAKFIKQALAGEPLAIYGDGNQSRDFLYVEDLIEALMLAAEAPEAEGVIQVATGRETTIRQLVRLLEGLLYEVVGKRPEYGYVEARRGEVVRNFADVERARQVLGWEPKWSLVEGLRATIKWYLARQLLCGTDLRA